MIRILILGGYGNFGGRLARLLADDARLTLLIAGRSYKRAKRFCSGRSLSICASGLTHRIRNWHVYKNGATR